MKQVDEAVNKLKELMKARFDDERGAIDALINEIRNQNADLQSRINEILAQKQRDNESICRSLSRVERALTGARLGGGGDVEIVEPTDVERVWSGGRYYYQDGYRKN